VGTENQRSVDHVDSQLWQHQYDYYRTRCGEGDRQYGEHGLGLEQRACVRVGYSAGFIATSFRPRRRHRGTGSDADAACSSLAAPITPVTACCPSFSAVTSSRAAVNSAHGAGAFIELEHHGVSCGTFSEPAEGPEHDSDIEPSEDRLAAAFVGTEDECDLDQLVAQLWQQQYDHNGTGPGESRGEQREYGDRQQFRRRLYLGHSSRYVSADLCSRHGNGDLGWRKQVTATNAAVASARTAFSSAGTAVSASITSSSASVTATDPAGPNAGTAATV
jgi:hypothetical protein